MHKSFFVGTYILEWALQNREFPQLYKVMKNVVSFRNFCSRIETPDAVELHKREFFRALRQACLVPVDDYSNVQLPSVEQCDFSQQYAILEDALNTINDHNLHKSKYGSGLHEFLIGLIEYAPVFDRDLHISIPKPCEHRAIFILRWALENKKMPELYKAMKSYQRSLCSKIKQFEQIEDPKSRFIFTVLNYVCGASETLD